jgi:hypothetical protein
MEPLSGKAEQISARIAAVISMGIAVIMNEDLVVQDDRLDEMLNYFDEIEMDFTTSLRGHQLVVLGRT